MMSANKPPKGALVKSQGIERLGKAYPRDLQVRLKETNENEPLMKCSRKRVVGTG